MDNKYLEKLNEGIIYESYMKTYNIWKEYSGSSSCYGSKVTSGPLN